MLADGTSACPERIKTAFPHLSGTLNYYHYFEIKIQKKNRNSHFQEYFWRLVRFAISSFSLMSSSSATPVYDIKSADLPLVAFQLKTLDLQTVAQALQTQLSETPGFFDQDPVLIDLDALNEQTGDVDFQALLQILVKHQLRPMAIKTSRQEWLQAAKAAGLVQADDVRIRRQMPNADIKTPAPASVPKASALADAMVLDKPLRSGQQVYAKGRDLIVLAMVNPGAEVLADGHIHVYAPLRGKAIAGARGFTGARIFAQSMDPELISIAGVYRTSENPLPAEVRGQAAQVSLQSGPEGDKLRIVPLKA
jgi:septum site-determining protein MinC